MRKSLFLSVALLVFSSTAHAYRISAWIPAWDANAVTIMGTHARDVDESNPGWYAAMADGSVAPSSGGENATLRAALTGTLLLPTIKNNAGGSFDGNLMAAIVNDAALREKHAEAIRQLVVQRAYDGIDIDYERMPATSKAGFTSFVQLLATKLHESNKLLSVTVYAKTGEATWSGPGAQDWPAIGAAADLVKIMAYDYHWSTSEAGAIAPLSWLDQIATYAESTISPKKVMIGLPWYGYDWLGTSGAGVTYAQATAKAQTAGAAINRDANGEATFSYSGRVVFFQDATSYRRKVDAILAKHPNIRGFAHWRVGAEDPAIWPIVAQLRAGGSTGTIVPPAPDFMIDGPSALTALAGAQTRATYRIVGINGFGGPVAMTVRVLDQYGALPSINGTTLTIAVPNTTAAGSYRLRLTMSGGGITREQLVTLTVPKPKAGKRRAVR